MTCRRIDWTGIWTGTIGAIPTVFDLQMETPVSAPPEGASREPPTATIVASYEALRRMALGQRGPDDEPSLGLAILVREGVAAWLQAWTGCPGLSDPLAPAAPPLWMPSFIHTELAQLWTQMALSHQEAAWR